MANFTAMVLAKVDYKEIAMLEKRIKKIEDKQLKISVDDSKVTDVISKLDGINSKKIKISLDVQGDTNVVKALSTLGDKADKIGANIKKDLAKPLDEAKGKAGNLRKELESLSYASNATKMDSSLNKYSKQNTNTWLKSAREARDEYKAILDDINSGRIDISNNEVAAKTYDDLSLSFQRYRNSVSAMNSELATDQQRLTKANAIEKFMLQNTKATDEAKAKLTSYINSLRDMGTEISKADLGEIDIGFKDIENEMIATDRIGKSLGDRFKNIGSQIVSWGAAALSIRTITFAMKQLVTEAIQVDSALTELRKVSNASDNQLSQYFEKASKSAQKFGALVSDVISSAADWSRLGYSLKDAEKLADTTTLLQRVGDNMTQESSSSGLISTLRGFGKQAEEAERIVDMVNEVANNEPIDTAGIFEGLSRSASSMSAANNTLEETIGIITAINSVVQDPTSIGTGLKTNLCLCVQKCA